MNDFLSNFIDYVKDVRMKKMYGIEYRYGNHGKLKKNREEKIHRLEAESKNYEHMLLNMTEEHLKIRNRVAQVTDHKYVMELREEVDNTKEFINQLKRYFYFVISGI
jgi:hypothetical protein